MVSSGGFEFGHTGLGYDRPGTGLDECLKLTKAPLKRLMTSQGEIESIP
jgi:hypothetical protein